MDVSRITAEEAYRRRLRGEELTFVDARNDKDWSDSDVQLPGALRVPADEVSAHLAEIPRDRGVVAYCT